MRIEDIMIRNPITVVSETSILEADRIMKENNIRRLPVVDRGKLVGMVTERMILEASPSPASSLLIHEVHYLIQKIKVKHIMVKNPITITPNTDFKDVLLLGREKRIGAFPIVDKGKLVGIVTESDLVRFITSIWGAKEKASTIIIEGVSQRFGLFKEVVSIIDKHEVPILSIMTYVPPVRVDCNLIIRVKTKEVDSLISDLKKAKFRVIHRRTFPVVEKEISVGIATESEISHHWWEGVGRRQTAA
jgi:acetoin utilization protein AcuB